MNADILRVRGIDIRQNAVGKGSARYSCKVLGSINTLNENHRPFSNPQDMECLRKCHRNLEEICPCVLPNFDAILPLHSLLLGVRSYHVIVALRHRWIWLLAQILSGLSTELDELHAHFVSVELVLVDEGL